MTLPSLLRLLLFSIILQTTLYAWPGGEEKLGKKEPTIEPAKSEGEREMTDPENISSLQLRGRTLAVKEVSQENALPKHGNLGGISIGSLDPSAHYSAAAKKKLAESLARLDVNHPDIVREIQQWNVTNFSYSALQELKKRIIKTLPPKINEPFQQGLTTVRELRLQAKQAEANSSEKQAEEWHQKATTLQTQVYEEREKYVQEQVQNINEIKRFYDVIERNKALAQAAQVALKIQPETPTWIGFLLSTILPSTPTAAELVAKFKRASSVEEQLAALNEIKKIDFALDFEKFDILDQNLENKQQVLELLEAVIRKKQPDALSDRVFQQVAVLEKIFTFMESESDQLGEENLQASLKEKRQASLDRIGGLAPMSLLVEKLTSKNVEENVPIDCDAVSKLINNAPMDLELEGSLTVANTQARTSLERAVFQFFCADIALKFDRACPAERLRSLNNKLTASNERTIDLNEILRHLTGDRLALKLRYMSLFLGVLSSESSWFFLSTNNETKMLQFRRRLYSFLNRANDFVEKYSLHPAQSSDAEFLPIVTEEIRDCFKGVYFNGSGRMKASMMELTRAARDQRNKKVAEYHLQAALFLLKSAHETVQQRKDNDLSSRLRQIGELYALAAYRERITGSRSSLSSLVAEDDMKAQDYADAARKVIAGEECLINNDEPDFWNMALRSSETKFYRYQLERRLNLPSSTNGNALGVRVFQGTEDPIHF
ncbi:MAG: hypothetical protein K2W97_05770 [Chthoniobacterales bacterium]|nr:hypothetical protein [Chthoniobacterales bacterium]